MTHRSRRRIALPPSASTLELLVLAYLLLAGCTHNGPPRLTAQRRAAMGTIGVLVEPGVAMRIHRPFTAGEGLFYGSAAGFVAGANAAGELTRGASSDGIGAAFAGAAILAALTIGTAAGAVAGVAEGAVSKEEALSSQQVLRTAIVRVEPISRMSATLTRTATTLPAVRLLHPCALAASARPPSDFKPSRGVENKMIPSENELAYEFMKSDGKPDPKRYAHLKSYGVDTVLLIDHTTVGLYGNGGGKSQVRPAVAMRTQLIRASDAQPLYTYVWLELGTAKPYVDWTRDGGAALREQTDECARRLGERMGDWLAGR